MPPPEAAEYLVLLARLACSAGFAAEWTSETLGEALRIAGRFTTWLQTLNVAEQEIAAAVDDLQLEPLSPETLWAVVESPEAALLQILDEAPWADRSSALGQAVAARRGAFCEKAVEDAEKETIATLRRITSLAPGSREGRLLDERDMEARALAKSVVSRCLEMPRGTMNVGGQAYDALAGVLRGSQRAGRAEFLGHVVRLATAAAADARADPNGHAAGLRAAVCDAQREFG